MAMLGAIPVVWAALLIAPYWTGNIFDVVLQMGTIFEYPMRIHWTNCSLRAVLLCLGVYIMVLGKVGRCPGCEQEVQTEA